MGNDDSLRAFLRTLLEQGGGFDFCIEASGGTEAIDKARRLSPHLAILDCMLTADRNIQVEKEALSFGINAVFSKLGDLGTLPANARAVCGIERDGHLRDFPHRNTE